MASRITDPLVGKLPSVPLPATVSKKGVNPNLSAIFSAKIFGLEVAIAETYPAAFKRLSVSRAPGTGEFSKSPFSE